MQVIKLLFITIYTTLKSIPHALTSTFTQISWFIYFLKCISEVIFSNHQNFSVFDLKLSSCVPPTKKKKKKEENNSPLGLSQVNVMTNIGPVHSIRFSGNVSW